MKNWAILILTICAFGVVSGPASAAPRSSVDEAGMQQMTIQDLARHAALLFAEGAYGEACKELTKILKNPVLTDRQRAVTYFNRGRCRAQQNEHFDAVDDFSVAITLGIDAPGLAFFERGLAYEHMKYYDQAAFDYVKAFAYAPENPRIRSKVDRFFSEL
jgi:tetratricopeptide (TPR) repeat protein